MNKMRGKLKKWVTFVWLGFLFIQFGVPMHSVYGIEKPMSELITENTSTGVEESGSAETQTNKETTEKESTSAGYEESFPLQEEKTVVPYNMGPNLLQNPEFSYNSINGGTITNWEMIGTTTPVNVLTRNVTFNGMYSSNFVRTSDSRFFVVFGGLAFTVSNQNSTATMIIAQTINTVPGRNYQISADFSALAGTVSFTMLTYNGSGVVVGNNELLNSSNFSLTNNSTSTFNWNTRSMEFTASGTQTTVSYRISQGAHPQGGIRFPNIAETNRSLTLQASPIEGGTPQTDTMRLYPGEETTLSANPNDGYQFVRWEIISGTDSQIEELTEAVTTFIMGEEDTIVQAIYEENQTGEVHVYHVDQDGHEIKETEIVKGIVGDNYHVEAKEIEHYQLINAPGNASGVFSEEMIEVTYIYEVQKVSPIDPLDPETEISPENKPDITDKQGLLSIDFVSQFNFGKQGIYVQGKTYYAMPQRLLNEDGTVNEQEKRPNYVQISDRRSETDRNGWQLSVTQNNQFSTENGKELSGARMRLTNQQLATAHGGTAPSLQQTEPLELVPGAKRVLLMAQGNEGTGTWIYRFGDANTAGNSVVLDVPKGANPEATSYSSTFTWELSAVPGN